MIGNAVPFCARLLSAAADSSEAKLVALLILLGENHQTVDIFIVQRLQQHGIDDGKHRRARADAKRKREDRDRSEVRILREHPSAVATVL